eukprot:6437661-Amphidinium_carterae.1
MLYWFCTGILHSSWCACTAQGIQPATRHLANVLKQGHTLSIETLRVRAMQDESDTFPADCLRTHKFHSSSCSGKSSNSMSFNVLELLMMCCRICNCPLPGLFKRMFCEDL